MQTNLLAVMAVCVASAMLGACAGSAPVEDSGRLSQAQLYQQAVERAARRRNVDVQWVNPPEDKDLERRNAVPKLERGP